ncbi:MAG TPA: helix-turn-helix domain-containing protein [Solirubrobacteraceae bacterium]
MSDDDLLTLPEIATILGVNPSTVRLWVKEQRLPAQKQGGRKWLVYRGDLDQMLADQPRIGHPRRGRAGDRELPEDWGEHGPEASFDLASSAGPIRRPR